MARIKKKGTSGNAKNYITRSQAVRKLQISLSDFRRLCIFKGIYPREPRSKKKASKSSTPSTTFYYAKDIQYLLHEPLLEKLRDQKALEKKISRALGRNEISDASRLARTGTSKARLDHIIKERYPTFSDALRDLDDALSMLFLFANLPSTDHVPAKVIARCQRLTLEFEHYLIKTHAIRKSFLSIKGIYYQATIHGQDILWLVPYRFVQRFGDEVDFRIMATFVEFYTTLLGFVNFRLYTSVGLVYPPQLDTQSEEQGAELGALRIQGVESEQTLVNGPDLVSEAATDSRAQIEANKLSHDAKLAQRGDDQVTGDPKSANGLDKFSSIDSAADSLLQPSATADSEVASRLFDHCTVFLSRESPRHPLEFLLKAFGCKRVGWDTSLGEPGAYCSENDARITHQVVDRPDAVLATAEEDSDASSFVRVPGRIYIQPQWVWDSINAGKLQRTDLYAPGATLPPHLSPWIKPKKGEYDPTLSLAEQELENEAEAAELSDSSEDEVGNDVSHTENPQTPGRTISDGDQTSELDDDDGMQVALGTSEDEDESPSGNELDANDDWGGLSDTEQDSDNEMENRTTQIHQSELEAEARGLSASHGAEELKQLAHAMVKSRRVRADQADKEEVERRKMMMPRRKRKMYEKMVYSNARKSEENELLRKKRRRIERQAKDSAV